MESRVVVTGFGLVTALGAGSSKVWHELLQGRSGVGPVQSFDTSAYPVNRGAEVKDFEPEAYLRRLNVNEVGPAARFAVAAARLALRDSGLAEEDLDVGRCGVSMGTTSGEPQLIEQFDDCWVQGRRERIGPEFMERYPCNMIPGLVAAELGCRGVNRMIPSACAAGNLAIGYAFDAIRTGRADLMLAGGADSFSRITYSGFARLGAIAPDCCRPFDRDRRGMVPGEGAGMLVLETLAAARARGAKIYAEVGGYGLSCDAHHMTSGHPEGRGAAQAMRQALDESEVDPSQVGYISAHGTGTATNDVLETAAVKRVFGKHAYSIPMSSIKSMLGHTMGAASAIEAAVCALAIHEGRVPPTMNLENPDPRCDLDYVPNSSRRHSVNVAMNNAYAFGGTNASLILKQVKGENE